MRVSDIMIKKLRDAFAPEFLDVIDESHRHEGHAGARPGGQTHYRVKIVASAFAGKSRVAIHRMINDTLAEELANQVHALAIEASAPRA
ncbi:ankyrin [Platysternon megacephalum]|uniref:Ankyrin n=1 Tax=Platysternon megacephalum TaxID=55544 RepID=A0A4D9DC18_9SAUR|nr:ankyrin [Platysternon megacephalum]